MPYDHENFRACAYKWYTHMKLPYSEACTHTETDSLYSIHDCETGKHEGSAQKV